MAFSALDPQRFAAIPLDEQISALREAYTPHRAQALLGLCGACRDHGALAWFCGFLGAQGWLDDAAHRAAFAVFLVAQSETAVDRVVKALLGDAPPASVGLAFWEALETAPFEKLSTICLLDRALKRHFPDLHTDAGQALETRCAAYLATGQSPQDMPLTWGTRLSARAVERLEATNKAGVRRWYEAVAAGAIRVLGDAPKALSQANAETLLARRVYADPGHFLIELLQNAEDSGAQRWCATFHRDALSIWHDGTPFDIRDLVGVCSIGQTTKRKQQIGFFGVGFKSVFEVTDRPQVYSGVFRFEVADVSIPKGLAARPSGVSTEGTTLRLPLRAPDDPVRSARALFEKATQLDPCVLLALQNLKSIELFLTDGDAPRTRSIHRRPGNASGEHTIQQKPEGWTRIYSLATEEARFDGAREAGRADVARIMVGVALDGFRRPAALPEGAPTVYSHLPTAEHTGLRFFVQAPFDVPVDRERITYDSAWNQWLLSQVPWLWRGLIQRFLGGVSGAASVGHAVLNVLPLPQELGAPIYKVITDGLKDALGDVDFLPCRGGQSRRPSQVVVVSPVLSFLEDGALNARFLEGAAQGEGEVRSVFASPLHGKRAEEVVRMLGALRLNEHTFVARLETSLEGAGDDVEAFDWLPACVRAPSAQGLSQLLKVFERALTSPDAAPDLLERLQRLPILPNAQGRLGRALGERTPPMGYGSAAVRALYDGSRALLREDLDPELNPKVLSVDVRLTLERLGVVRLGPAAVLKDVEGFPSERLYAYLGRSADGLKNSDIRAFLEAPVYEDTEGARLPLALSAGGDGACVRPCEPSLRGLLSKTSLRLLSAQAQALLDPFLAVAHVEPAGIAELIEQLRAGGASGGALTEVQEALAAHLDAIASNPRLSEALPALQIWPSVAGGVLAAADLIEAEPLRALIPEASGSELASRELHDSARARFEALSPWVLAQPAPRALVALVHRSVRPDEGLDAQPSWLREVSRLRAVLEWLIAHMEPPSVRPPQAHSLKPAARGVLGGAPSKLADEPPTGWPLLDAKGCLRLGALRAATPSATGVLLHSALGAELLHPALYDLAPSLKLDLLTPFDVLSAIFPDAATLTAPPSLSEAGVRRALYRWIEEDAQAVFSDPRCVALLRRLPVFLSAGGRLVAASDLVIDADLSTLGLDCQLHGEVPQGVGELLVKHLDAGNPPLRALVERHLVPAYQAMLLGASEDEKRTRTARLLGYIGQRLKKVPRALDDYNLGLHLLVEAADGALRPPNTLYRWSEATEALIGDAPSRFISAAQAEALGEGLCKALCLRGADEIGLEDLRDHIDARLAARLPIPQRIYQWMEEKLKDKQLDGPTLVQVLGSRRWLCSDDGACFPPGKVLACTARRLFGERRGYWEDGARRCPTLRDALGLPTEASPEVISDVLKEISDEIQRDGDGAALLAAPALPRMVLACFAALGRARYALRRDLPIVPCHRPGEEEALRFLPANTPGLVRDDAPELSKVLAATGRLYVAHPGLLGDLDERDAIDDLYNFTQIPKLRAACTLSVNLPRDSDQTHKQGEAIGQLRRTLGALSEALVRVRRHPTYKLNKAAWCVDGKLKPFVEQGPIRVVEPLTVRYALHGVGDASNPAKAIYDPAREILWLDRAVVTSPQQHAVELAVALVPCVYEGAEQSQLIDLLTLLLSQGRSEAMHALLDRRQFPTDDAKPRSWLFERLCDLRDYGFLGRLSQEFAVLSSDHMRGWSEREAIDRIQERAGQARSQEAAARAAALLLPAGSPEALTKALIDYLAAPTLDAIPQRGAPDTPLDPPPARAPGTPPPLPRSLSRSLPQPRPGSQASVGGDPDSAWIEQLFQDAGLQQGAPSRPSRSPGDGGQVPRPPTPAQAQPQPQPQPQQQATRRDEVPARGRGSSGLWDRVAGWFGYTPPAPPPLASPPGWAQDARQGFSVPNEIPSQLWASGEALQSLNQTRSRYGFAFDPPCVSPHIYAIQTVGGAFDPATQSWIPPEARLAVAQINATPPTGERVRFRGLLPAGEARLPLPMFSWLCDVPRTPQGAALRVRFDGLGLPLLDCRQDTEVCFEVALLSAPGPRTTSVASPDTFVPIAPCVGLDALPGALRDWIRSQRKASPWQSALGAEQFIRAHYTYDADFMTHPDVERARRKLKPNQGNHHIALLHAGGDKRTLGRGVCYELNTLLVEVLRHLGVASWVATGWVLKNGWIARPSHLFALALLPTEDGGALVVPLEGAAGEAGRPLSPLEDPPPQACPHCGFLLQGPS